MNEGNLVKESLKKIKDMTENMYVNRGCPIKLFCSLMNFTVNFICMELIQNGCSIVDENNLIHTPKYNYNYFDHASTINIKFYYHIDKLDVLIQNNYEDIIVDEITILVKFTQTWMQITLHQNEEQIYLIKFDEPKARGHIENNGEIVFLKDKKYYKTASNLLNIMRQFCFDNDI